MTYNISALPIYLDALNQSMPGNMMRLKISINNNNKLVIENTEFDIKAKINILAYGKASRLMYLEAKNIIGNYLGNGLLITHEDFVEKKDFFSSQEKIIKSSHPLITEKSIKAGKEVLNFVSKGDEDDILMVLISGGGSAMVALPVDEISIKDKIDFITKVMHMSVPEREVNILKKSLSKIKGGRLAEATIANTIVNCILSDEREHDISAISSGMTVCNKLINPIEIMNQYNLWKVANKNITNVINKHGVKEDIGCSKEIFNSMVGSREDLIESIVNMSKKHGFDSVHVLENMHSCTSTEAVNVLIAQYNNIYASVGKGNHLIVTTGEIQVKVPDPFNSKGGRNQHMTAIFMLNFKVVFDFYFLAIATDGVDYINGVHGAFYDSKLQGKVQQNKEFIQSKIKLSNSYDIHKKFGTLIEGGKTGTNVSDFFLFSFNKG